MVAEETYSRNKHFGILLQRSLETFQYFYSFIVKEKAIRFASVYPINSVTRGFTVPGNATFTDFSEGNLRASTVKRCRGTTISLVVGTIAKKESASFRVHVFYEDQRTISEKHFAGTQTNRATFVTVELYRIFSLRAPCDRDIAKGNFNLFTDVPPANCPD